VRQIDISDVLAVLGVGLIAGGLAAWDWRVSMVVVGAILLAVVMVGALRSGRE
jgi:hypothetical protein